MRGTKAEIALGRARTPRIGVRYWPTNPPTFPLRSSASLPFFEAVESGIWHYCRKIAISSFDVRPALRDRPQHLHASPGLPRTPVAESGKGRLGRTRQNIPESGERDRFVTNRTFESAKFRANAVPYLAETTTSA